MSLTVLTVLYPMTRPKVLPEDLPLFQQLAARAISDGSDSITEAEYRQLEHAFIAAQGAPGAPAVLWGWGNQRLLRDAVAAAGVRVQPDPVVLHPFVLERTCFARLRELECKIMEKIGQNR